MGYIIRLLEKKMETTIQGLGLRIQNNKGTHFPNV